MKLYTAPIYISRPSNTNKLTSIKCSNTVQPKYIKTERGGSVVTHETCIRDVSGLNPGADQPDWGFFVVFLNHQVFAGLYFHYHDPFHHYSSNSYIIKLKSINLTNEHLLHKNRNTQPSGTHPKTLDAI